MTEKRIKELAEKVAEDAFPGLSREHPMTTEALINLIRAVVIEARNEAIEEMRDAIIDSILLYSSETYECA